MIILVNAQARGQLFGGTSDCSQKMVHKHGRTGTLADGYEERQRWASGKERQGPLRESCSQQVRDDAKRLIESDQRCPRWIIQYVGL